VLGRNRTFLLTMAAGSVIGTFIGGLLLGIVPSDPVARSCRHSCGFSRESLAAQV